MALQSVRQSQRISMNHKAQHADAAELLRRHGGHE